MKREKNLTRIRIIVLSAVLACLATWLGQPLIHGNKDAINVIVTVFSILAGFLVAIIAVVGEHALSTPGTWRLPEMSREKISRKLVRHKLLFYLYLITLGLVFITLLLYPNSLASPVTAWFERGFLFSGVFAFSLSLMLPEALIEAQKERLDVLIESRKQKGKRSAEESD